jgi:hypothetical protein
MPNNIAAIKNYTTILDRVCQREVTSSCLNSPVRMARGTQREGDHNSEGLRLGPGRLQTQRGSSCQCGLPAKINFSLTAA